MKTLLLLLASEIIPTTLFQIQTFEYGRVENPPRSEKKESREGKKIADILPTLFQQNSTFSAVRIPAKFAPSRLFPIDLTWPSIDVVKKKQKNPDGERVEILI